MATAAKQPSISNEGIRPGEGALADGSGASSEAGVIDAMTLLAYRKWLIVKLTAVGAAAGIVTSLLLPVRFTAMTRLMTPQQTSSSAALLMSQLASTRPETMAALGGSSFTLKNPNDLYIGLLSSRTVADDMIRKFGLMSVYHAKNMTAARKMLSGNTRMLSEKSGLIAISVTDADKTRAADLTNAYTAELRGLTQTMAVTEASQRRAFYEEQLKHAKEDLVAAEFAFQQVQQKKGLVQLDTQAKATIEGLAALQARIAAQQVELQALRTYSTERNPGVQLGENELSTLEAEAAQMEARSHSSRPAEMGLQDVAGAGLEYIAAEHELQYRQILFDLMLKQYDAARLDEAKDAAVVQVVEAAVPPDLKSSPHRVAVVLLFAAFAFLISCSYILAAGFVERHPVVSQSLRGFRAALLGKNDKSEHDSSTN